MALLSMRMPSSLANVHLATQTVEPAAPSWAASSDVFRGPAAADFELRGHRTVADIFRLPRLGGVLSDWLYSRPEMEALGDDAFRKATTECSTVFRIDSFSQAEASISISPTISNHWLLVPCQTINQYTVGLCYLDVVYKRDQWNNCVPPVRVGRFAIDDNTGEVFVSGWEDDIMIVGWIQSIIKCERVRELMLFEAPPNGEMPTKIVLRNSFYERRDCRLCGIGPTMPMLPPPCSGVSTGLSVDPTQPRPLFNVGTLYRRFRGGYFGLCLKTSYPRDPENDVHELVPIYVNVRHGYFALKQRFTLSLQRNVAFVIPSQTESFFGITPWSNSRLWMLRASEPVDYAPVRLITAEDRSHSASDSLMSSGKRRRRGEDRSASVSSKEESSVESQLPAGDNSPMGGRSRIRNEDDVNRDSVLHMRKIRNRESAARANALRKSKLEAEKRELTALKQEVLPELEARHKQLRAENEALRGQIVSRTYFPWSDAAPPTSHTDTRM